MTKKRQEKKARQRKNRELAITAQEEALEVAEEPEADIVAETEEKDLDEDFELGEDFALLPGEDEKKEMVFIGSTGPKSLSELEDKREAQEKTFEVRRTTWDTEDVISNIINDPSTEADVKAKEITNVAQEMKNKINSILSKKKELAEEFDFDLAQAEILSQGLSKMERLKAKVLGVDMTKLNDKTQVRLALAEAVKMIKKGGEEAVDARSALPAIKEAAKALGIGQPSEKNWTGFIIEKDSEGDYRWVAWVTNNRKDLEGDIITDEAHKEFLQFMEETPEWHIDFMPWHQKELTFTHQVDAWMYKDGFMIYSGKLEESEAIGLMGVAKKETLGMSHGFIPLQRDDHIIQKFRTFEVSVLPLHNAANPYTTLEVMAKEANIVDKKAYLRELLGEERFEQLSKDTESFGAILDEQGVEAKEIEAETPAVEETTDSDDALSKEVKAIIDTVSEELGMPELSEAFKTLVDNQAGQSEEIGVLKDLIKSLVGRQKVMETEVEKEVDDKLAEIITSPNAARFEWQKNRPSQSEDNEVKEDDEILKDIPKSDLWLSNSTQTKPLPKQYVEENL